MSNQTPATKISMSNFLSLPKTSNFLEEVLKEKKPEFVSNLIALCDADSNLAACDPAALMKCSMNAVALNLPLNKNLGLAYVIPYNGIPQFQIGYKGFVQLAIRTGSYRYINTTEVRDGEISRNKITGEIKYNGENPSGKIIGYISYLELMSGFSASVYMTEEEIELHASMYSKVYQKDKSKGTKMSKWSDPVERGKMAKKTVLKKLLGTYGLMTTEFQKAFDSDNETDDYSNETRGFDHSEVVNQPEPSIEAQVIDQPEPVETVKI